MTAKRRALVTGGNGGIGTEVCKALAHAGFDVITTCLDPESENIDAWQAELLEQGFEVGAVQCNVTDIKACQERAAFIEDTKGPVDTVVNLAGITRDGLFHKMDEDSWDAVVATNLNSAFNVTRQFMPQMRQAGFGRIINVSSVNGQKGQFGQANYSAAKAGLHGLTMALAQEGAAKGITANTVSPGYIATPMTEKMPQDVLDNIKASVPAGRLGEPSEIARVIAFLADAESGYINGANIPVNGGLFTSF